MPTGLQLFGDKIRGRRLALNMKQEELAGMLEQGVSVSYISKIERGKLPVPPSERVIRGLAEILGLNADDLLQLAGKIDRKALQAAASETPEVAAQLRIIQRAQTSGWDKEAADLAYEVVAQMASGLLRQDEAAKTHKEEAVTMLDRQLQQGWNKLTMLCIAYGPTMPPRHVADLVRWLHEPIQNWPVVGERFGSLGFSGAFLEVGNPTPQCRQWGQELYEAQDAERELEDLAVAEIIKYCKENVHELAPVYIQARQFLAEHPILHEGRMGFEYEPNFLSLPEDIQRYIERCYEPIPDSCKRGDMRKPEVMTCARCGWTLEWPQEGGEPVCYSSLCMSMITENGRYRQESRYEQLPKEAIRTKRGVQSSVGGPETALLQMYEELSDDPRLQCSLWPEVDRWDLSVVFPDGAHWAIDLKDRENPTELAKVTSKQFTRGLQSSWDRAFWVFPDYRTKRRGYMRQYNGFASLEPGVAALSVSEMMAEIHRKLDELPDVVTALILDAETEAM
jgi:transcriptional regulator with XRE-family HTH domain